MRRKMKKLVHKLEPNEFDDWYHSWFRSQYKFMSKEQRKKLDELYYKLKEETKCVG